MRYAVIIAGGAGTRLWPMSRDDRPKQLLPFIVGDDGVSRSLIEIAAARLEGLVPRDQRLICAAERHRGAIRACVPWLSDEHYLGEPSGRDTLNAVGLAAAILRRRDEEAVFAVLTADHLIEPVAEFARGMELAFQLVEDDPRRLVTFSIEPTSPATGYGYVERGEAIPRFPGAFRAKRFVEKPDLETARGYLAQGGFGWNSGMFVFSAHTVMQALERLRPESFEGLSHVAAAWDGPRRREVLDAVYPTLPRISIDYGLMEPASRDDRLSVCTVPLAIRWKDVGSWPSYGETLAPDGDGNRGNGPTLHLESANCLCVTDDPRHTIATIGCHDLVIVHTRDATLVCHASAAERVKEMAGKAESGRSGG